MYARSQCKSPLLIHSVRITIFGLSEVCLNGGIDCMDQGAHSLRGGEHSQKKRGSYSCSHILFTFTHKIVSPPYLLHKKQKKLTL